MYDACHKSPVKVNWPQSAPFRVSETRQGYVVVVLVITVFATVIITYIIQSLAPIPCTL